MLPAPPCAKRGGPPRRAVRLALVIALLAAVGRSAEIPAPDAFVFHAYLQSVLAAQVARQVELLTEDLDPAAAAAAAWVDEDRLVEAATAIRTSLVTCFGIAAPDTYRHFVARLQAAERSGDPVLRAGLLAELRWDDPAVADYHQLRRMVAERLMAAEVDAAAAYLAQIQTWIDISRRESDAPDLEQWLAREVVWDDAAVDFTPAAATNRAALTRWESLYDPLGLAPPDPGRARRRAQELAAREQLVMADRRASWRQRLTDLIADGVSYPARVMFGMGGGRAPADAVLPLF